jgi:hypothetical protein
MLHVAERIGRREFETFRLRCEREKRLLGQPPADGGDRVSAAIQRAQTAVDDAFVTSWAEWSRRRHVLLTIDFFDQIADDEMGRWLARLALRLTNTLVVVTRESPPGQSPDSARWRVRPLAPLSRDEVSCYLDELFCDLLDPTIVEEIYASSWGYPGVLSLVAEKIRVADRRALTPESLRRMLPERLQAPSGDAHLRFIDLITDLVGPSLLDAVYACAAVNVFDEELLGELIDQGGASDPEPRTAIQTLAELGIIERVEGAEQPANRFRLHGFIRAALSPVLQESLPGLWRELHRRAAQYYFRVLLDWEDNAAGPVASLYKYEHPAWLTYKREWFFHTGWVSGDGTIVRARFALLFLEAFWWYGCYAPFYVNQQMLDEWKWEWQHPERTRPENAGAGEDAADERLHAALKFVLENYPTGWAKSPVAPWDEIRDQLLVVRDVSGVDQPEDSVATPEERQELAKLDGHLNILLAHSRRYRDPADGTADSYYQQAISAFTGLGDDWNLGWLHFEIADLVLERGSLTESAAHIRDSAEHLERYIGNTGDWDEELIANLFRIRADINWQRGDEDAALIDYCRAVGHAYRFLFSPVEAGADQYKILFYEEMTARTTSRLIEIVSWAGVPAGRRWADRARRLLPGGGPADDADVHDMLHDADLLGLRVWLFPRAPRMEEAAEAGRAAEASFIDEWTALNGNTPDSGSAIESLRLTSLDDAF